MNTKNKESKAYKNKIKYIMEYNKKCTTQIAIRLNNENDKELIKFFKSSKNKPQLIRDMYEAYKRGYDK